MANTGIPKDPPAVWGPSKSTKVTDHAELTARNGGTISQETADKLPEEDQRQIRPL